MKYKVYFSGFAYVEADGEAEARELFEDDDFVYMETSVHGVEVVEDFEVRI